MFAVTYILAFLFAACGIGGLIARRLPEAFWETLGMGDTTTEETDHA